MVKVNLMPNESIILKSENIAHGGLFAINTDELILTNRNIIHVKKGVLGNTKNIKKYPVNQIKIFNGEPQAIIGKHHNGSPQLEIYFQNGHECFRFQSWTNKEVVKWINCISNLVKGHESNAVPNGFVIPGTEYLSGTIKGTVDTFKNTFAIKTKQNDNGVLSEKVAKKCISCSAPLIGEKRQTIQCHYCDTEQLL